jgi:hypothetical protein
MRIEAVLAILFALFAVMTIMDPQWIEQLLKFDPDNGSGEAEWGLVMMFGVASLVASLLAGRDWRLIAAESTQ